MAETLYGVSDIAEMFNRTRAWFYWCDKKDRFTYENGDPILPDSQTSKGSNRRYGLDTIQEIALSLYRNQTLTEDELREVIGKILLKRERSQDP